MQMMKKYYLILLYIIIFGLIEECSSSIISEKHKPVRRPTVHQKKKKTDKNMIKITGEPKKELLDDLLLDETDQFSAHRVPSPNMEIFETFSPPLAPEILKQLERLFSSKESSESNKDSSTPSKLGLSKSSISSDSTLILPNSAGNALTRAAKEIAKDSPNTEPLEITEMVDIAAIDAKKDKKQAKKNKERG